MSTIGLSTAFFTDVDTEVSGDEIACRSLDAGFRWLELDNRLSDRQLRGLLPHLTRESLRVGSVHNPFPRPPGIPPRQADADRVSLSSLDRGERQAALRLAGESMARAADLGANAVVLHLGRVTLPEGVDPDGLESLIREGRRADPAYGELRDRVARARLAARRPHLDAALWSLDRAAEEALRRGVRLGLENRYHPHEIPDAEELGMMLRELEGAPLGYWHDTGHGASLVAQGFLTSPLEVVEAFRSRLVGMHLHDARGLDDHLLPGDGELRFAELVPFAEPGVLLVMEVHPGSGGRDLARGLRVLGEAGFSAE